MKHNQQSQLLNYFPVECHSSIVEFFRHVASIDADIIIFMARKSVRLYDVFEECGFPATASFVYTDHILDQDASIFFRKNVAIVDDTLILGTSLHNTKKFLSAAGAKAISTHVLFADRNYWKSQLIEPDFISATIDHQNILSFCNSSVVALQANSVPYLTDFPFSKRFAVASPDLQQLLALDGWTCHRIQNHADADNGAQAFSLLPSNAILERLARFLTTQCADLVDIVKIRVFVRRAGGKNWIRIVPMVTLAPMLDVAIKELSSSIIESFFKVEHRRFFSDYLVGTTVQLRFAQYFLSTVVGFHFQSELEATFEKPPQIQFDSAEAARHYGLWCNELFDHLHSSKQIVLDAFNDFSFELLSDNEWDYDTNSDEEAGEFVELLEQGRIGKDNDRSLIVDLMRAFVGFYYKHEVPARIEIAALLEQGRSLEDYESEHRDRLGKGFTWRALSKAIVGNQSPLSPARKNTLSLCLDHLVDWGIAVPILAERDGLAFRAYRHGEGVPFADQEIALIHDLLRGYFEASETDSIGVIGFEKVIACLMRVGVNKGFLEVVHGMSGHEGIARIGFHLHGAVPFYPKQDKYLADDKASWISSYATERGVVIKEQGNFKLGNRPDAALKAPQAKDEAQQLGWLLGKLRTLDVGGKKALNANDLIILATCSSPLDLMGALNAEGILYSNWIKSHILSPNANKDVAGNFLTTGVGVTAINSTRLKVNAFRTNRFERIIEGCRSALQQLENGAMLQSVWGTAWSNISKWEDNQQLSTFVPLVEHFCDALFDCVLFVSIIKAAYIARTDNTGSGDQKSRIQGEIKTLTEFRQVLRPNMTDATRAVFGRAQTMMAQEKLTASFEETVNFAERGLRQANERLFQHIKNCQDRVNNYGRTEPRINFTNLFWYDVVDSLGEKSGLSGNALKEYRGRVRNFKKAASQELYKLKRKCESEKAAMYPYTGSIFLKDDEKTIFFAKRGAFRWALRTAYLIKRVAKANGVVVRMMILKADFAGLSPFRYSNSNEVDGEQFWEHSSRLKLQLRAHENANLLKPGNKKMSASYLWLCGWASNAIEVPRELDWNMSLTKKVETNIDEHTVSTNVLGGYLG